VCARARARAFHLYLVSSENARGRGEEGEAACSRELSKCMYERRRADAKTRGEPRVLITHSGAAFAAFKRTARYSVLAGGIPKSLIGPTRSGSRLRLRRRFMRFMRYRLATESADLSRIAQPLAPSGLSRCGDTKRMNPRPVILSFLVCLQAEELNTIVGNAFRMAYVAQLQRQPILQDVISPRSTPSCRKDKQEHRSSWVRLPFLFFSRTIGTIGGGAEGREGGVVVERVG